MRNLLLCLVIALACSATWAQDPALPCLLQLKDDPQVQALLLKMPFDVTKGQPLEVLANKSKPTAKEKAALSYFASEGEKCLDLGSEWRKQNYPAQLNSAMTSYRVDLLSGLADLYAENITYGELAKRRAKMAAELSIKVDSVIQEVKAQRQANEKSRLEAIAQQNQADREAERRRAAIAQQQMFARQQAEEQQEEARRQGLLQLLMNQRQAQPYQVQPYQIPVPKTTNCFTYGNQVNCTTR